MALVTVDEVVELFANVRRGREVADQTMFTSCRIEVSILILAYT